MLTKGENRITSYFPRSTSRQTPAKRTRQVDEADSVRKSSIKKSKSRQEKDGVDIGRQPSPSTPSRTTPLSSRRLIKKASRTVIDIRETQPNTPTNSVSLRITTPPSSPLPVLTPSPSPPRPRNPSYYPSVDTVNDNEPGSSSSISIRAGHLGVQEAELELIPSSQTQNLDLFYVEEDSRPNIPPRKPEYHRPSQSSSYIPSSQPDTTHLDLYIDPDEFIASSQSQFMELTPTSPIDPDSELVPSSQTQELYYSQAVDFNSFNKITVPPSGSRSSLLDKYINKSQTPAQSSERRHSPEIMLAKPQDNQLEPYQIEGPRDFNPTIPSSQSPQTPSGPSSPSSQGGEGLLSSQLPENTWNDELSSYESLPDAVKDLQDMFSGTYESYPPDFPMSLR